MVQSQIELTYQTGSRDLIYQAQVNVEVVDINSYVWLKHSVFNYSVAIRCCVQLNFGAFEVKRDLNSLQERS